MRALVAAVLMLTLLALALAFAVAVAAAMVVGALQRHRIWSDPGLPMHELIAPTGELQDPQYGDRRRRPADEVAARRRESNAPVPLLGRAPWVIQKGARSVHHG